MKDTSYFLLRCKVSPGQFADELAVSGVQHNGETFSLFADRRDVECPDVADDDVVDGAIRVVEVAREGSLVLVRLPGLTLANGRTITVRADELQTPSWQEA